MSVKGLLAVGALLMGSVAIGAQASTNDAAIETALSHIAEAELILEGLLTPPSSTVPPTTPPAGFSPPPLALRGDIPDPVQVWQTDFHPDAPGVRMRVTIQNGTPTAAVLLDTAGTARVDPLVNPLSESHEHTFLGVVPSVLSPLDYWAQPNWLSQRPATTDDTGSPVIQAPGVWMPTPYVGGQQVELLPQIPVYYECGPGTVSTSRRAHMLPVGTGWVTEQHQFKVVDGKWRINFFGPIGFHESIQPGPLSSPQANRSQLWYQGDGELPSEAEGWFATPQVEVYWKTRVDGSVDLPALIEFGGPDTDITPHMDYVSGSTPIGDRWTNSILIDWACNQPGGRHSMHAIRLD